MCARMRVYVCMCVWRKGGASGENQQKCYLGRSRDINATHRRRRRRRRRLRRDKHTHTSTRISEGRRCVRVCLEVSGTDRGCVERLKRMWLPLEEAPSAAKSGTSNDDDDDGGSDDDDGVTTATATKCRLDCGMNSPTQIVLLHTPVCTHTHTHPITTTALTHETGARPSQKCSAETPPMIA